MRRTSVVIPCYNEEEWIGSTLEELLSITRRISGCQVIVVDDGSTDESAQIVERFPVHLVRAPHQGLSQTWMVGIKTALDFGAEAIVTLDADGQYEPRAIIPALERLDGCDLLLIERGDRYLASLPLGRRILSCIGQRVIRYLTGFRLKDPVSGFRIYSAHAARLMEIRNRFTYTLESLLIATVLNLEVSAISHDPRPTLRKSRLFRHPLEYVGKQALVIFLFFLRMLPKLISEKLRWRKTSFVLPARVHRHIFP